MLHCRNGPQAFCGVNAKNPFNWREAQAPTFENLLTLNSPRADVKLPEPVAAAPVTSIHIQAAVQAMAVSHNISIAASVAEGESKKIIHATALPKQPPSDPKPSDLMMAMVQWMDLSLQQRGIAPPSDIKHIYTAQDAAKYLADAKRTAFGGGA